MFRTAVFLLLAFGVHAASIVPGTLFAVLDTGALAGVSFPVSFSYDAAQVNPTGASFISLTSFDFTLLGVPFHRDNIFQGGQVIFRDDVLENVTASFQGVLPPQSPVNNITFGFGGPGVIGYIDLSRQFGHGTFTINAVPEPSLAPVVLALLLWLMANQARRARRERSGIWWAL